MLSAAKRVYYRTVGRLPLVHKVSAALILLIGLTLTILWVIVTSQLSQLLHQQTDTFGRAIVNQTANSAAELLLADDLLSLNVLVTKVTEASNVVSATITDIENKVLAQSGSAYSFELNIIDQLPVHDPRLGVYIAPVTFQDVRAGYAYITIDKQAIESAIEKGLSWMTMATLILLMLAVLIAILLARSITDPIKRLTLASYAIRKGEFGQMISNERQDEIGQLVEGFNEMSKGLEERDKMKDTFNRYFDPSVARKILSNIDSPTQLSKYVDATVLFVDIVGFTKMCEEHTPDAMVEVLNTYYALIHRASVFYRGVVDKYIGDGAMVLFGVPDAQDEHSFQAICCALVILGLVERVNEDRRTMGLPVIEFRVGLHSGEMLAGCLGCDNRLQYTVVGDAVNVAARLCNNGVPKKVVVSQAAFKRAHGEKRLVTSEDVWSVKGKSERIQVQVIEALSAPFQFRLSAHIEQLYEQVDLGPDLLGLPDGEDRVNEAR